MIILPKGIRMMKNRYIRWKDGSLTVIDQQRLPAREVYIKLKSVNSYYEAIRSLKVRGAPLIGVAAAYGVVSSVYSLKSVSSVRSAAKRSIALLKTARPTAVNIFNELTSLQRIVDSYAGESAGELKDMILKFAEDLSRTEEERCARIGMHGAPLIKSGMNVLTHCNTGMLATSGIGTALGIIYTAHEKKKKFHVYVPETRPLLQGGRLTAYELKKAGIPHTLITDNMRGHLFLSGLIDISFVGADRIAMNGDTANKIGTLESALFSRMFSKPFYVAAPTSTVDRDIRNGKSIIIEERSMDEVREIRGVRLSVAEKCFNPAFDVTPARYIDGIITERGISEASAKCIKKLFTQ